MTILHAAFYCIHNSMHLIDGSAEVQDNCALRVMASLVFVKFQQISTVHLLPAQVTRVVLYAIPLGENLRINA
jgi:hypothetical protein